VQAPLSIDNASASWSARQFAAEYAIQFREMLPTLARLGLPLPLGGSSNQFRTETLRALGGWDPYNVTEDADLGFRLALEGYRTSMIAPPTYEEAPVTLGAWLGQRTRWIKGHMQTYLTLMRDPADIFRRTGPGGFFALHMTLGAGVASALLHGPLMIYIIVLSFARWHSLSAPDVILVLSGYCVAAFSALTATALSGELSHARAALTMPLYWPLSSIAAFRAFFALIFRPHRWAKTIHGVSQRPPPLMRAKPAQGASRTKNKGALKGF
jgi:cellulose synthase/poly-beta-1,6-N-acetylglucosamine synthase-like glycosyltransferase